MGRRKIEIEPITDERNRTVTFIKRKAGLFKKAHELAVLCQVDVTLIILGHNNTFYEFSSVDTKDLLTHYSNDKSFLHDIKDPSFYGSNFKKKRYITTHQSKNNNTNNNTTTSNANISNINLSESDAEAENNSQDDIIIEPRDDDVQDNNNNTIKTHKRSRSKRKLLTINDNNDHHLNKKFRIELNNNNNNNNPHPHTHTHTQQSVQKQFQQLNNIINPTTTSSTTPTPKKTALSNIIDPNKSPIEHIQTNNAKKLSSRPILRVQIPQNNVIGENNSAIKSEPSSTNPSVYGNTSPQHYKHLSLDQLGSVTRSSTSSSSNDNDPVNHLNKNTTKPAILNPTNNTTIKRNKNTSNNNLRMPNTATSQNNFSFTNGLPPLSAMSPYIATPLQSSNFHPPNNNNNNNNTNLKISTSVINNNIPTTTSPLIPTRAFNVAQQQQQQQVQFPSQRYTQQVIPGRSSSSPTYSHDPSQMNNNNTTNNNNNPLPSKYVNDLVIPSPSVFPDWNFTMNNKFAVPSNPNPITNVNTTNTNHPLTSTQPSYDPSNGNTGLTPYITLGQTPLNNRFFNFPTSDTNSPDLQDKKSAPSINSSNNSNNNTRKLNEGHPSALNKK